MVPLETRSAFRRRRICTKRGPLKGAVFNCGKTWNEIDATMNFPEPDTPCAIVLSYLNTVAVKMGISLLLISKLYIIRKYSKRMSKKLFS